MTQTFPLTLTDFALMLPIKSFAWRLVDQQEISGLAGGNILVADIADPYWQSKVILDSMPHDQAGDIQALIESLDGSLNNLYFHDPRSPCPKADPDGAILTAAGSIVQIAEINADNKRLRFKGLPAGYQLQRRDWFSFDFAAAPVHRAYHRILTSSVAADAFGITDWIEFRPHLQPGAAVDAVVTLINAAALVKVVPKSFSEGQPAGTMNFGMSFEIRQVL